MDREALENGMYCHRELQFAFSDWHPVESYSICGKKLILRIEPNIGLSQAVVIALTGNPTATQGPFPTEGFRGSSDVLLVTWGCKSFEACDGLLEISLSINHRILEWLRGVEPLYASMQDELNLQLGWAYVATEDEAKEIGEIVLKQFVSDHNAMPIWYPTSIKPKF